MLMDVVALFAVAGAAGAQTPGSQSPQSFEKKIVKTVGLKYLLYLPKEYSARQRWPLLLFLHGAGESGDDLEKVKTHGPPKLVAQGKDFPFIIVSPQSPGGGWDVDTLNALLDVIEKKYTVDEDRVYLTGLSMGGFGTWALAIEHPERFAAIVPIAAGGTPWRARRLKSVPAWVFHGAKDPVVPLKADQDMVDALHAAGGDVKFTIYPDAGHDSWTQTYDNPDLYDWLLQHKRQKPESATKAEGAAK
jgi:predicted peptidase